MIDSLKRYIQNLPGTRLPKKIVIIESDDWGSIRMPNKSVYSNLLSKGYKLDDDPYLRYDSIATEADLTALFDVLHSYTDYKGSHPSITANCVVANPDFDKIKDDNFRSYYYENIVTTMSNYHNCHSSFDLWNEGINKGLFKPQFHGREHLNVHQWMRGLRDSDPLLLEAFNNNMISISSESSHMNFGYMEGNDFYSIEEKNEKASILKDGIELFNSLFGYKSLSFISNCYIWHPSLEKTLFEEGVEMIQGINNQLIPIIDSNPHRYKYIKHFFGQKNKYNQRYIVRNIFFEPSINPKVDWVNDALKRIKIAFQLKKPAIIGSHRLNFIGSINESNRKNNLRLLNELLGKILANWPDVEFMTTDQLKYYFND